VVLGAAEGIEQQTRKLLEVCRLREVPIIIFVNNLDREGPSTFSTRSSRPWRSTHAGVLAIGMRGDFLSNCTMRSRWRRAQYRRLGQEPCIEH
jgi:hypothetical protein